MLPWTFFTIIGPWALQFRRSVVTPNLKTVNTWLARHSWKRGPAWQRNQSHTMLFESQVSSKSSQTGRPLILPMSMGSIYGNICLFGKSTRTNSLKSCDELPGYRNELLSVRFLSLRLRAQDHHCERTEKLNRHHWFGKRLALLPKNGSWPNFVSHPERAWWPMT